MKSSVKEESTRRAKTLVNQVLANMNATTRTSALSSSSSSSENNTTSTTTSTRTRHKRALTHMGGFCYRTEQPNQPAIQSVAIFLDKPVSIQLIKERLQERVISNQEYYRFASVVDEKHEYFVPVAVNVDDHVHEAHIYTESGSLYGDSQNEDEALRCLLSDIVSMPLRKDIPMWEIVVIDDCHSKGFILFWRVHHVIGDGSAMVICCQSLFDGDALGKMEELINQRTSPKSDGADDKLKKNVWHSRALKCIQFLLFIAWFVVGFFRILFKWTWHGLVLGFDPQTVLKREPGTPDSSEKRIAFSSNQIPVHEAKTIARSHNATVNDLMLCCLAGAIDRYTSHKSRELKRVDIRVTTPVNIRTSLADFKAPRNKFGFMVSSLPLGLTDSVKRLQWIKEEMDYNKQLPERYFSYVAAYVVQKVLPDKIIHQFYGYMSYLQSVIATNIQSPADQLEINGAKLLSSVAFTPTPPGVSLGLAILSYHNHVNIALTSEKSVIPDPELLIEYFIEEYNVLKAK